MRQTRGDYLKCPKDESFETIPNIYNFQSLKCQENTTGKSKKTKNRSSMLEPLKLCGGPLCRTPCIALCLAAWHVVRHVGHHTKHHERRPRAAHHSVRHAKRQGQRPCGGPLSCVPWKRRGRRLPDRALPSLCLVALPVASDMAGHYTSHGAPPCVLFAKFLFAFLETIEPKIAAQKNIKNKKRFSIFCLRDGDRTNEKQTGPS